jgi:hypothetical protein
MRCSIGGSVPPEWNHVFDEVNEACQPLRLFINATEKDDATIATVHLEKVGESISYLVRLHSVRTSHVIFSTYRLMNFITSYIRYDGDKDTH